MTSSKCFKPLKCKFCYFFLVVLFVPYSSQASRTGPSQLSQTGGGAASDCVSSDTGHAGASPSQLTSSSGWPWGCIWAQSLGLPEAWSSWYYAWRVRYLKLVVKELLHVLFWHWDKCWFSLLNWNCHRQFNNSWLCKLGYKPDDNTVNQKGSVPDLGSNFLFSYRSMPDSTWLYVKISFIRLRDKTFSR